MVNPLDAKKILSKHFEQITLDEFNEKHAKYVVKENPALPPATQDVEATSMILYQREAARLGLSAYFASALTGLNSEQRENLFAVSDIVESVCDDLEIELYQPRKVTDPVNHPDVTSEDVFNLDKERVLKSDLLIHIADYPSTGAGEELDIALGALIPIVLIAHGDTRMSRMVSGIPALKLTVTYRNHNDLRHELRERLTEIRPIVEVRKLSFTDFDKNMVGSKVRILRQESELTPEQVAVNSDGLLTVEKIRQIEGNNDKVSNPSLLELRTLAAVLKTTVADLVEPDLDERMIALLQEWMLSGVEGRSSTSIRDQRVLLRRLLYRVLDKTEVD